MKGPALLLALLLSGVATTQAQTSFRKLQVPDSAIIRQADSVKAAFTKEGFVVVKEASMKMESGYEIPVIVPLTQGINYQFVFIGAGNSNAYEVRMFDWNEKELLHQKKMAATDGNVISYAYVPTISEYHMVKPVQVNTANKNPFGYVILLKKASN